MREHYYFRVFETDEILGRDVFMILEAACFLFSVCSHEIGRASRIALCPCSSASTTSLKRLRAKGMSDVRIAQAKPLLISFPCSFLLIPTRLANS